ncbi:hypothetical protein TorRG33x02_105270 [Trema orientale]|uniref:RNase H type-1 domain-containing protein n=1 Tax=Trema orientale TaxID=63057 RepID=A0A2P5F6W8_TREOI|nr:hypothetical protein TorRG33x02_105270 [Trema orientale]
MNLDATIHPRGDGIGTDVIFQDHTGSVIAALSKKLNSHFSVEVAKVLLAINSRVSLIHS